LALASQPCRDLLHAEHSAVPQRFELRQPANDNRAGQINQEWTQGAYQFAEGTLAISCPLPAWRDLVPIRHAFAADDKLLQLGRF